MRLSEAPSHGLSIIEYDPRSVGAVKYLELAQEIIQRNEHTNIENMVPRMTPQGGELHV